MIIHSKTLLAGACSLLLLAQAANANEGEISFNGRVSAPTCLVNGGNRNVPVALPEVNAVQLSRPGQTAGQTTFELRLTKCSPGMGSVSTYFEPGASTSPEGRLLVDAGGSENVQLQLLNDRLTPMDLSAAKGAQGSQRVQIDGNGSASLRYAARYYATGAATPGEVTSRVQYSLDYL